MTDISWRLLAFLAVVVSSTASAKVQPYPQSAWFEQDPAPVPIIAESIGNPLDYAGARIGLDVRNVELPRGWEGGYRYCCRFPIIDYVSNRPLYMKQWAEDNSALIVAAHRQRGLGAVFSALDLLRGDSIEHRLLPFTFEATKAGRAFEARLSRSPFSPRYRSILAAFYSSLYSLQMHASACASRLSKSDRAFFASNPGRYLAPDGKKMADITGNTDSQIDFIEHARRVDYATITGCAAGLSVSLGRYVDSTRGWRPEDFYAGSKEPDRPFVLSTPLGKLVVGGPESDTFRSEAAILIDVGGDDVYMNSAGGSRKPGGVVVNIDHAGDDKYLAPESSYVQGFGFLGVGMLVDLAGNDVYKAKHFSQGAGIMGVGVLWDKAGNDTFSANTFCQGAGMFGLGMMLDDSGDDVYDCASNGQGSATTLGLGILSDLAGNDKYRLACDSTKDAMGGIPGYGQGGALSFRAYPWEKKLVAYGGVGMLVDDKGNDEYVSKGWNCQGGSYIMSLGVLVDNEGNDHYVCGTGQGSGIHVTNAILIDKKGDDIYEGGFRAGGSGGDRSPGFLIDYEGNDTYKSATSSYGTGCKPFSYSLFIDYKGNDKYICDRPKCDVLFNDWHSFGGVWPESDPNAWPYAICLDLGGRDDYQVRNRTNNSETHSFGHGIFLDMEWNGGDVIGKVKPVERLAIVSGNLGIPMPGVREWFAECFEHRSDPFERFWGVGQVLDSGTTVLREVSNMGHAEMWSSTRDALECIGNWFARGEIGDSEMPYILGLLWSSEPEVRLTIADDFGLWKMSKAEGALLEAAEKDSNAQARRFALRSLIRLESAKAKPVARKLATEDTSEDVRRMAVTLVGKVKPDTADLSLFRWVLAEDHASSVRCAAAEALGNLGDARAVEPLRNAARTYDVYVQRACGKALCALYQVEGVDLLIKSMSFPSIDAFYNYDRNVPNYVSTLAGFDLPDSERYVQAKWQAWFDTHRDSINIRFNADAYKAWTNLSDSLRDVPDTAQVARYEAFLARFPGYQRAKAELASKLNGIAWNLATGGDKARKRLALTYALRAVELSDDVNIWDTVIEAYLANGMKVDALRVCREELAKHPNEQILKDRLGQLERK
jgi:HEAT repeat protein